MRGLFRYLRSGCRPLEGHAFHRQAFPWLKRAREREFSFLVATDTLGRAVFGTDQFAGQAEDHSWCGSPPQYDPAELFRRGGPGAGRRGDLVDPGLHLVPDELSGQLPRQPLDLGPWRRNVVLPARRIPMTACTFPGTAGSRASRRVNGGGSFGAIAALSFSKRIG
jgi:hypothetical protein